MKAIKEIFKSIAHAKFNVDSTTKLESHEVTEIWKELSESLGKVTGIYLGFPSEETQRDMERELN